MLQYQLKLKLTKAQEKTLLGWLWNLTGVWNFAVRKIEQDAKNKIYHSDFDFMSLLVNHSERLGIPSHVLQGTLKQAKVAWNRCFKKLGGKPRLKGCRRPLNSVPFPDPIKTLEANRVSLPIIGKLKYHKQVLPKGKIKCARLVKRASGWYLCLFIDAFRKPIQRKSSGQVGIDPGFKDLLTLSTGEKIRHPRELEQAAKRLAQSQRGHNKQLTSRIHERIANQKKDRNHKLSLKLVENFTEIYFSKDNIKGIANKFGKSVSSSNHYQLRQMLKYKSLTGGTKYVEVESKNSTLTCSKCKALTGPTGLAGLKVRHWECKACGATLDRDVNAALNTLSVGAGRALESAVMARQET